MRAATKISLYCALSLIADIVSVAVSYVFRDVSFMLYLCLYTVVVACVAAYIGITVTVIRDL